MAIQRLLSRFPNRRINPFDGMAVTADVWREAHEFHAAHQRLHALSSHGSGIITGLEVIASNPPSRSVYILPGIAIDPAGNTIVVPEPVAYDLGSHKDGELYLLITYDESRPRSLNGTHGDQPLYVYTGFNIEAVADAMDSPQLEVARINAVDGAPVRDAVDRAAPRVGEIDLRFRREIGPQARESAAIGVAYLSRMGNQHGRGLANLTRAVNQRGQIRAWTDDGIALAQDLSAYTLIALVARDRFQVEVSEVNALYNYIRAGGTLFIESCRREGGANPASDASFNDLLESLGIRPETVGLEHQLLQVPHLFARPPFGYETQSAPLLRESNGVIWSTYDHSCLWCGERRTGPAEREAIRSAMEWGENLLHYALERRRQRAQAQSSHRQTERAGGR